MMSIRDVHGNRMEIGVIEIDKMGFYGNVELVSISILF